MAKIDSPASAKTKSPAASDRAISEPIRPMASQIGLLVGLIAAVLLIVVAIHWPVLHAQALSFDDAQFLTDNPLVQNPSWTSVRRFLGEVFEPTTVSGYYLPLSMISLMLDYAAGGSETNLAPFHRTSLLLHAVNTALIILLMYQLFGRPWIAACVGLLFAAHPMTVEPIAWVGERKTLLAAFFAFLTLIFYVRHAQRGGWIAYGLAVFTFILSLMSKPTSTPLPLVLLIMDYWPLRRLNTRTLLEKIPFFAVALISTTITLVSHERTAEIALSGESSPLRIPLTICHLIVFYIRKILWPVHLSSVYPLPEPLALSNAAVWIGIIGTLILIAVLIASLRWTRALLSGWLIFFLTILPTLGVVVYSWVIASDKYVYLPAIGLLLILAWYLDRLMPVTAGSRLNIAICIALIIIVGLEAVGTRKYLREWQTTERLALHIAKSAPKSAEAQLYLGKYYCENDKIEDCLRHTRRAYELDPNHFKIRTGMGNALAQIGELDEAIEHYREAVRLRPGYANAQYNLAFTLARRGRYEEALEHYKQAVKYQRTFTKAHVNMAVALSQLGRFSESIEEWRVAKQLDPFEPYIRYQLGGALIRNGQVAEGMKEFEEAIRLAPGNLDVYYQIAEILVGLGRFDDAKSYYENALKIKPDYAPAHSSLSAVWLTKGDAEKALNHAEQAVQFDANFAEGHINLGVVLAKQGQIDRAMTELKQAVSLEPRNITARMSLGVLLQGLNKNGEAAEQYQGVLKIDPQHAEAKRALQAVTTAASP